MTSSTKQLRVIRARYYKAHKKQVDIQSRKYQKEHPSKTQQYSRTYRTRLKDVVLTYYSKGVTKPRCVKCGEERLACLTIDHIRGGGRRHRKIIKNNGGYLFYLWLMQNKFPKGYQTLCMNCQFIKKHARLTVGAF